MPGAVEHSRTFATAKPASSSPRLELPSVARGSRVVGTARRSIGRGSLSWLVMRWTTLGPLPGPSLRDRDRIGGRGIYRAGARVTAPDVRSRTCAAVTIMVSVLSDEATAMELRLRRPLERRGRTGL